MSKVIQAFLSGIFFTFIIDFFLFLGIKINYINLYHIPEYYNTLFADYQNIFLFLFITLIVGYATIYAKPRVKITLVGILFAMVFLTLYEPIGMRVGSMLLMQKSVTLKTDKYIYTGDILYSGRENIYFHSDKLNKMLIFHKNRVKVENE